MTMPRLVVVALVAGLLLSGCGAEARSRGEVCWDKFGLGEHNYADLPAVLADILGVPVTFIEGIIGPAGAVGETLLTIVLNLLSSFGLC